MPGERERARSGMLTEEAGVKERGRQGLFATCRRRHSGLWIRKLPRRGSTFLEILVAEARKKNSA